jgi:hypothetical protein
MFKTIFVSVMLGVFVFSCVSNAFIVDHTCTDLRQIPQSAIEQAKTSLHIAYGHTSHGSQLTDGMSALVAFANGGGLGLSLPTNIFAWNNGGSGGALDLHDYAMANDVGYYPGWVNETIAYLDNPLNADVNVIIWSWCGQASGYTQQQMIDYYLAPMSQLEIDYSNVTFVYMTSHLNGTGQTGNLNLRNQQIRDYCIANNKMLYDFADIESYDPDGLVHYMPLMCNDNCDYDSDGNGSLDKNWALDWQNSHTLNVDWYSCSAAHSQSLNGNRKAYAAWYLFARLADWNGCTAILGDMNGDCRVDWEDLMLLTVAWLSEPGQPEWNSRCDIMPAGGDEKIDIQDFAGLSRDWMQAYCDESFAGDFNHDCHVGWDDLMLLAAAWLSEQGQSEWDSRCDIMPAGGDGKVDFEDFCALAIDWSLQEE